MNFLYLLPFTYFLDTRLRGGSVSFHLTFEWLAAALLSVTIGAGPPAESLLIAFGSYLAFISLYEIGYLINDIFAARKEAGGRKRGPQGASSRWIGIWFGSRVLVFLGITVLMGHFLSPGWWSFFAALAIVFSLHNLLEDKELKTATFQWLGWLRFMAPVLFVIEEGQLLGVGLAAAVAYVAFRMFGYMDSKGLLQMSGRQRPGFRLFFFLMPLAGVLALWPYDSAKGFVILSGFFALVASVGTLPQLIASRRDA